MTLCRQIVISDTKIASRRKTNKVNKKSTLMFDVFNGWHLLTYLLTYRYRDI